MSELNTHPSVRRHPSWSTRLPQPKPLTGSGRLTTITQMTKLERYSCARARVWVVTCIAWMGTESGFPLCLDVSLTGRTYVCDNLL
jgi:hypothetical protein